MPISSLADHPASNTVAGPRPYRGSADLTAMQQLLRSTVGASEEFPTLSDLPELLESASTGRAPNAVVWEDANGKLAGFAIVSSYRNLHYNFLPGALKPQAEQEMMDWAESYARSRFANEKGCGSVTVDASVHNDDREKVALLERHGFKPTEVQSLRMTRSLTVPVPEPRLPAGFSIRALAGGAEVEDLVRAHRSAYGTDRMTVEERLAIMAAPYYRPELDLVTTAPDGRIAALCLCTVDDADNRRRGTRDGEIAIIGTRKEFQRRGLGRAMVRTALRELQQFGLHTASLGVSSQNAGAVRLYEVAGFRVQSTKSWYSKRVSSGKNQRRLSSGGCPGVLP